MGLTRPTAAQIDSSTEVITDPISLLNNKSNRANVDVGFLFNRDGGISSNVAVFWQESNQRFVFALTSSNAVGRFSNIAVTSNANVVAGNVFAAGYFYANGAVFSGGGGGSNYSNVDVVAYLAGNITTGNITTAGTITVNPGTGGNTIISKGNLYIDGTPGILRISSGYTGGFQIDGNGPRLGLGTLANTFAFFDVYAINNNTYINSSSRPLYIGFSTGGAGGNVLYMDPRWGNTVLNTNVASISTTTGAFVVTGGVGIGGNLNVGGNVSASLINASGNVLATGLSIFGNVTLGSMAVPGALNTLAGNVSILGVSSMLNIIGNIVVNNTAIASSNVTGAIRTTGGIGVGGNLYVGQRVGYVWGANNVSSVYQVFNNSTNSLDTVFG